MMVLCKFKKSVKYYINYILLLNYHIPFLLKTFFFFLLPFNLILWNRFAKPIDVDCCVDFSPSKMTSEGRLESDGKKKQIAPCIYKWNTKNEGTNYLKVLIG